MKYLHSMVRVLDLDAAMHFYRDLLGLVETRRVDVEAGRFSLIYLATAEGEPEVELTHNWDEKTPYSEGNNFGHLAFEVENIYTLCEKLQAAGVVINRPPRDGFMAFVRSPDGISIELLQAGEKLPPQEPWLSMDNTGAW